MSIISQQPEVLQIKRYFKLYYYENNFLHVHWQGYVSVEQVKTGCELILEAIQTKNCFRVINDNRKLKGSWTQAIRWLEKDFMPRLLRLDIQKVAFLYSPDESARYSVDRLLEINDKYEAQTFKGFNEASNWLNGTIVEETIDKSSILIKTLKGYTNFQLNEICYISRADEQTLIQTIKEQFFTKKTLSDILKVLPQPEFFRIHKSHVVNVSKIRSLKYHKGGYYHLFLNSFENEYLTVSKNKVSDLRRLLE